MGLWCESEWVINDYLIFVFDGRSAIPSQKDEMEGFACFNVVFLSEDLMQWYNCQYFINTGVKETLEKLTPKPEIWGM